ncbi:MAG TPA: TIGR03435 family protein [Acidobacteriaceae bacterium]|nr:TIGR03435 family protein [Acidobacteriaceae bacterium]
MRFDVVSIRRDRTDHMGPAIIYSALNSDAMTLKNMSLHMMIAAAYTLPLHNQIIGLPKWADVETYDMEAKVSETNAPAFRRLLPMQRNPILRSVLSDRFHLTCHFETRILAAYALVIAKDGHKLTEAEPKMLPNGMKDPGGISTSRNGITATAAPISLLMAELQQRLGRPVVDRTGLTGRYTFKLSWTPDSASAPNAPDVDSGPSIFTAIQEQLGLRLEGTHAPVQLLVVDHVERPTEN